MKKPHKTRPAVEAKHLQLRTPGDGSSLAVIRATIADLARKVGFADDEVAKIEMAVDEACSNIIKHAYARDKEWHWQHRDPEIRLEVRSEDGRLIIELNDHGQRFDFAKYQPANINIEERVQQMKTNGYGIFIMRSFMDEVQYSSSAQTGNTLRLVKYLKKT